MARNTMFTTKEASLNTHAITRVHAFCLLCFCHWTFTDTCKYLQSPICSVLNGWKRVQPNPQCHSGLVDELNVITKSWGSSKKALNIFSSTRPILGPYFVLLALYILLIDIMFTYLFPPLPPEWPCFNASLLDQQNPSLWLILQEGVEIVEDAFEVSLGWFFF